MQFLTYLALFISGYALYHLQEKIFTEKGIEFFRGDLEKMEQQMTDWLDSQLSEAKAEHTTRFTEFRLDQAKAFIHAQRNCLNAILIHSKDLASRD